MDLPDFAGHLQRETLEGAFMGQICQRCGVSLDNDWRGDAWETVGEGDVPCVGVQGHLEDFREGKLEMLLDSDLVRERVVGSSAVG